MTPLKEDHETWLTGSADDAFAVLKPYHPVSCSRSRSAIASTPRNQGPELIQPRQVHPQNSGTWKSALAVGRKTG